MSENRKRKVLGIVGPTASGKTSLAIDIALKFNGEIISADSRQVYRGLNIGTEKVSKEERQGVPHHLIDVCDPEHVFSVQEFIDLGDKAITAITSNDKLPIVAGGTGFYVDALLYEQTIPNVAPDPSLRHELESETVGELYAKLQELDPERAEAIDPNNKRRLVRAIEVASVLGKVPTLSEPKKRYDSLLIGIQTKPEELKKRIEERLDESLLNGLLQETISLLNSGVNKDRMNEFGLEYRIALEAVDRKIDGEEMREKMLSELNKYAKRQRTWFKRNKDIHWISLNQKDSIFDEVSKFIKK